MAIDTRHANDLPVRARSMSSSDADWWRIRELLVRTHHSAPPYWNWDIRRWDGSRFHSPDGRLPDWFERGVRLWETDDGVLVGAVHPEDGGDAFLELDPDFRHLQPAMLDWAERNLATAQPDGGRRLDLPVWDYDLPLRRLLEVREYRPLDQGVWVRRLRFGRWRLPERPVASGYRLRTTEPTDADCRRMADLLNASFGRSIHTAAEYRGFVDRSPSFRHDLNLVAESGDGTLAAHVGVTYDEANRHGIFEPVCTHPDHRRHGLAQTLIFEGLRRLRGLEAETAYVDTGDQAAANALYVGCGFTEEYRGHVWRREIRSAG